jgi:hypothetical protein
MFSKIQSWSNRENHSHLALLLTDFCAEVSFYFAADPNVQRAIFSAPCSWPSELLIQAVIIGIAHVIRKLLTRRMANELWRTVTATSLAVSIASGIAVSSVQYYRQGHNNDLRGAALAQPLEADRPASAAAQIRSRVLDRLNSLRAERLADIAATERLPLRSKKKKLISRIAVLTAQIDAVEEMERAVKKL